MKTIREQHIMSERNGHTVRVKTSELTDKQLKALAAFDHFEAHYALGAVRPTQIGMACGKPYATASSWANSAIKKLVSVGAVKSLGSGRYRITGAGRAIAAAHWGEYADIPEELVDASDDASVQTSETSNLVEGE